MRRISCAAALAAAAMLSACSAERGLSCESTERYQSSRSAGPVRVPDDLSVPDESEALRIPPEPRSAAEPSLAERECLESPPDFFEGGVGGEA